MKKSIIGILISISLFLTSPIYGSEIMVDNNDSLKENENFAISGELSNLIVQKGSIGLGKKIPVSIEFDDKYDRSEIEEEAYKVANIDIEEIEKIELEQQLLEQNMSKANTMSMRDNKQDALMEKYDNLARSRTMLNKEHTRESIRFIVEELGLSWNDIEETGTLIPIISLAWLTPEEIFAIGEHVDIKHIEYVDTNECVTTYITEAQTIIGGDVFTNAGYTGENIKVGVIDAQHPSLADMGEDAEGITLVNAGNIGPHSTQVCGIVRKMAPEAQIYSYSVVYLQDIISAAETLIDDYGVHVINMSCGSLSTTGNYDQYSRQIDELVYRERCTICIAAGNPENSSQTIYNRYVNRFGLAPNAITVGAVTRTGTDPSVTGAYQVASYSMYRQADEVINKPDICAPGNVVIYGEAVQGTSFATPLITGTVVQMMARNSGLRNKPETLKAALIASATYNGGSSMSHLEGSIGSDREGAGVVDAEFCYYVARNGRRWHFEVTESGYNTIDVYCDHTDRPFRIAVAWYANSSNASGTTQCMDYDLAIFKNGVEIASSTAYVDSSEYGNANYEVVSIPASILQRYGPGYYQVRVGTSSSTFKGPSPNVIGVAWEQIRY